MQQTATTPRESIVARALGVVLSVRLKSSQVESSFLTISVIRLDGASL